VVCKTSDRGNECIFCNHGSMKIGDVFTNDMGSSLMRPPFASPIISLQAITLLTIYYEEDVFPDWFG